MRAVLLVVPRLMMAPRSPITTTARVLARHRQELVLVVAKDAEGIGKGSPQQQLLCARLDRIAALARRMVDQARVNPQTPASGLVFELTRIVEEAEG